ncbi:MAG TPA: 5-(carboxyamino)imidazole ribonucleotide synthase [Saprospiraceae bacterium]|nr:5-(carboxyamino)imidazole ribonucleotide synthase [Saprospiraceae bacterium]
MDSAFDSSPVGILGGGQLGKMLAQAGADWNLNLHVLDPAEDCPAACCAKQTLGDFRDYETVLKFGADKKIITIEIEDVNTKALEVLSGKGIRIYPGPEALGIIKDKGSQKQFLQSQGIPTSEFSLTSSRQEIENLVRENKLQTPFVQKLRTSGYDGRGVLMVNSPADLNLLLEGPSLIEEKIRVQTEIAVLAARNTHGEVATYEPVEMIFHPEANLLLYQESPASISPAAASRAREIAADLIHSMKIIGLLAVEFLIDENDQVLVNEVAPRPHNSGHHTIEGNLTSQYHQHLRCILGLPLGLTQVTGHTVLINLLGEPGFSGPAKYQGIDSCLALPGVYVHLYGKKETRPWRKLGHVNILGKTREDVKEKADWVRNHLKVIS